jgi:sugar/nucleoside kinase (ribokinase family)
MERVLPAVDLFVPSLEELAAMLGHRTDAHGARLAELSEEALGMGAAVVVIKLGDQGLHLRTSSDAQRLARLCATLGLNSELWRAREVLAPCFEARSVAGTTGSGDATIAGLLAALLRGEDPVSAATSATAVGACSVEAPDATSGIGPWPEVAERIARGWPRMSAASQETA